MRLSPGVVARVGLGLAVLLGFQALALIGYRAMEARRGGVAGAFRFERVDGALPVRPLTLERRDGTMVTIAPGGGGETVLLHFWATWCPPCRKELPAILALGRKLSKTHGVRLVAVATDPDWDDIGRFFNGDAPPEVLRDATGEVSRGFAFTSLPDTYLITADGRIRLRFAGARDWHSAAAVEILLRELEPPATR